MRLRRCRIKRPLSCADSPTVRACYHPSLLAWPSRSPSSVRASCRPRPRPWHERFGTSCPLRPPVWPVRSVSTAAGAAARSPVCSTPPCMWRWMLTLTGVLRQVGTGVSAEPLTPPCPTGHATCSCDERTTSEAASGDAVMLGSQMPSTRPAHAGLFLWRCAWPPWLAEPDGRESLRALANWISNGTSTC